MNSSRFVAVVSLAVGIALAVALSSIADAILFRPLPVTRPEDIVRIYSGSPHHSLGFVSYPDYEDLARDARTVSGIIAQTQVLLALGVQAGQAPEVRLGLAVTPNYFDVLGVPARLGRTFRATEDRDRVVVLADAFWRRRFGGDRAIVGQDIRLSGVPFTVIGVAPPGFGLDRFLHEDFYFPIGIYATGLLPSTGRPLEERGRRYLSVYARRASNLAAVQAEMASIGVQLALTHPDTNRQQKAIVMTELAARLAAQGSLQTVAWVLLALAALCLAIGCANVSGLLLLRHEARAGVLALKVALGASPVRLFREIVTESLTLAILGASAAIPLAWAALKAASRLWVLPTDLPMTLDSRLDARMAVIAVGAALLATFLCAAAPWRTTRCRMSSLRHTSDSSTARSGLVILQVAFATALVATGASLLAAMISASHIDLGYRTDHILLLTFDPSQTQSGETRTRAFYRELLDRSARLSGIRSVALAQSVPLGFTAAQKQVKIAAAGSDPISVWMNTVTPGYFELMRMPLTAGRTFTDHDTEHTARVAVVNQALAKLWPTPNAIGQIMEIDGQKVEVVGVAKTGKYQQVGEPPKPFFYLPHSQNYVPRMTLHVLTYGTPASAAPDLLAAARAIDPVQPASEIRPFDQFLLAGALFGERIGVMVTASTGGCAWLLSLTGLYACIESTVHLRRREIAIRMALGAGRPAVIRLVLAQGLRLAITGIALGLVLAAVAQHWISRIISPDGRLHLPAQALAATMVAAASLASCLIPAWQAAREDSAIALRRD